MGDVSGLGLVGLMVVVVGWLVGLGLLWLVIRDATRATIVVARLSGLSQRVDGLTERVSAIGQLLDERLPRQP